MQLCLFAKNVGNWVEMDMSFGRTSIQGTFESSEFFLLKRLVASPPILKESKMLHNSEINMQVWAFVTQNT